MLIKDPVKGMIHMYVTESLPQWFWIVYYSLGLLTMAAAIFSIILKKGVWGSLAAILITMSLPIVGIVNGIENRVENQDELEQWLTHLGRGSVWAYYLLFGYLYLLVWWGVYVNKVWRRK